MKRDKARQAVIELRQHAQTPLFHEWRQGEQRHSSGNPSRHPSLCGRQGEIHFQKPAQTPQICEGRQMEAHALPGNPSRRHGFMKEDKRRQAEPHFVATRANTTGSAGRQGETSGDALPVTGLDTTDL